MVYKSKFEVQIFTLKFPLIHYINTFKLKKNVWKFVHLQPDPVRSPCCTQQGGNHHLTARELWCHCPPPATPGCRVTAVSSACQAGAICSPPCWAPAVCLAVAHSLWPQWPALTCIQKVLGQDDSQVQVPNTTPGGGFSEEGSASTPDLWKS